MQTVGQHQNAEWVHQHTVRMTASHFGEICKAAEKKDMKKLAERLVSPISFLSSATQHGIKYESVAVSKFEELYGKTRRGG
jgi:hypothetical protein